MGAPSRQAAAAKHVNARLNKPPLVRIFAAQLIALGVIVGLLTWQDWVVAYSVLIGGLISIGPNAYFAKWAYRYSGARAATQVANAFYRGEAGKFLLTAILFAGTFAWLKPLDVVAVFLSYMILMALNWILMLCFLKR